MATLTRGRQLVDLALKVAAARLKTVDGGRLLGAQTRMTVKLSETAYQADLAQVILHKTDSIELQ
jgi:hypothetical protein